MILSVGFRALTLSMLRPMLILRGLETWKLMRTEMRVWRKTSKRNLLICLLTNLCWEYTEDQISDLLGLGRVDLSKFLSVGQ